MHQAVVILAVPILVWGCNKREEPLSRIHHDARQVLSVEGFRDAPLEYEHWPHGSIYDSH
jgi:hypothetical protein